MGRMQSIPNGFDGISKKPRLKKIIKKGARSGKWQAVIDYYVYDRAEPAKGAKKRKKSWKSITKLLDVACYPGNDRGRRTAEAKASEWFSSVMEGTDERTKRLGNTVHDYTEAAISSRRTKRGGNELAPHTMDDYIRCLGYIDGGDFPKNPKPGQAVRHIDGIGHIRVENLTKARVKKWVSQLQQQYAAPTVRKALAVLRDIGLQAAIEDEAISTNPAYGIEVPDPVVKEPTYLDKVSLAKLMEHFDSSIAQARDNAELDACTAAIYLALRTGLREAEVCGLKWEDVDLDMRTLSVRRVIARSGNSFIERDKPKTQKSRREVPVPSDAIEALHILKARMDSELSKAINRDVERREAINHLYIFGWVDGRFRNPRMLYKRFKQLVSLYDLRCNDGKPAKFHDLRHTFATLGANNGVDMGVLKKILGHSSESTTRQYYVTYEENTMRKAIDAIGAEMRERAKPARILDLQPTGTEG